MKFKFLKKLRRKKRQRLIHVILRDVFILFIAAGFFGAGILLIWASTLKIPDFTAIDDRKTTNATEIYDRTGEVLLYSIHEEVQQTKVPFNDISLYVKNATVAIEDSDFYTHHGVRPLATLRAVFIQPLRGSGVQGGSTITQQVIKNTLLTSERTISRKMKEWVLAFKLEQAFTKDEILSLYLNEAPYGGNIYGIEEASLTFFGKHAKDLNLTESAYLAALPQRPTVLSPYGNHLDLLEERKNLVLSRMRDIGFISEDEYNSAISTEVTFVPRASHGIKAPHFVTWVRERLAEMYGERALQENGYKVITTLDYELQSQAEAIVAEYGAENEVKFNAKNAGMVGIDPKSGDVLVMVGSRDYFDVENDGNYNTTLSPNRQPGSSFKPFVYATAFEMGYTPETVLFNVKTQFSTLCDAFGNPTAPGATTASCFMPKNYDYNYTGPMSLRDALAQSVNVPAVKLLYLIGIKNAIHTAENMGITTLTNPNEYGLTLVLGSGSVSLLEMTNAYGVFANEGVRVPYQNIIRIEDGEGTTLRSFGGTRTQVMDKNIARQISDVLSDNVARTPAFGANSYLYFGGRDVAVKTGTTNDYRDAWIIGYTPSFVLGTWVGNNDNSSMEKKVAGFIVAPMWHAVMQKQLAQAPVEEFVKPETTTTQADKPILRGLWQGGESYVVDALSGKLATERTPSSLRIERVIPNIHNILFWVNKSDPRGAQPGNPLSDPQYLLWEIPVQVWANTHGYGSSTTVVIPTEYDDIHVPEKSPKISISSPSYQSTLSQLGTYTITINQQSTYPIVRIEYYINNVFIGESEKSPFNFSFTPNQIKLLREDNELKAVAHDVVQNTGEATTLFRVQ
jgi:penicillin-binding protein 1C